MRARSVALTAALLLAGCGDTPPPDAATSKPMIEQTVLDWHRYQAEGNGEAGCRLLTEEQQKAAVKSDRRLLGADAADSCEQVIDRYAGWSEAGKAFLRGTVVDSVQVDGDRATVVAHASATRNGVVQPLPPVTIPLVWHDGRWLID